MAEETARLTDTPSDHFRRMGQAPLAWQVVARELICSGNVLCRYFEATKDHDPTIQRIHTTLGPAMVLYGFAVENLLKALLVAQGVDATSGGELNQRLRTHNLPKLAQLGGLSLSGGRETLLQHLQGIVESGRYPVAVRPIDDEMDPRGWSHLPCSQQQILELLEAIEDELRRLRPETILWKIPLVELGSGDDPARVG